MPVLVIDTTPTNRFLPRADVAVQGLRNHSDLQASLRNDGRALQITPLLLAPFASVAHPLTVMMSVESWMLED